ncbi:hypothetical protein [Arvimicrobium flavum]|uniref:hypothetical protein n=1 Tax=Arvimicrobium flavum TaxID=3393320 RepID=UPI00237AE9A4|nr:hypothetical protein [Mesorhizobium shangrilense]
MKIDVNAIAAAILAEGAKTGGTIWEKVKKAAPLYVNGYASALADIATGVHKGEITKSDARMYLKDAQLLLAMGIAHTCQITLFQAQRFFNSVIAIVKTAVNTALPVPLL